MFNNFIFYLYLVIVNAKCNFVLPINKALVFNISVQIYGQMSQGLP